MAPRLISACAPAVAALFLITGITFEAFAADSPHSANLSQAKAFDIVPKKTFHITQNDVRLTVQVPDSPVTAGKFLMRVTIDNLGNEPIDIGEDGRLPFCHLEIVTTKGETCPLTPEGRGTVGLSAHDQGSARFARLAPSENLSWTFPISSLFTLKPDSYLLKLTLTNIGQAKGHIDKSGIAVDHVAFTIESDNTAGASK